MRTEEIGPGDFLWRRVPEVDGAGCDCGAQFKATVLVNASSATDDSFKAAFQNCISSTCPGDAWVDFFGPIEAQIYPEPAQYDLIVLTGGTVYAMAKDIP